MKSIYTLIFKPLLYTLFAMLFSLPVYARVICVDANATVNGNPDGSCWSKPFLDLQGALNLASIDHTVDQIWMAAGVYKPSKTYSPTDQNEHEILAGAMSLPQFNPGITNDGVLMNYADNIANFNHKLITFNLVDNVSIYGGFQGQHRSQGGEKTITQRNPNINLYQTILDGNLSNDANAADNVWHVLVAGNDITLAGVNLTLDRLVIRNGNASPAPYFPIDFPLNPGEVPIHYHDDGGGLYIFTHSNIVINNVIFQSNSGIAGGALFMEDGSHITINNSQFNNNSGGDGGAIMARGGGPHDNVDPAHRVGTLLVNNSSFFNNKSFANGAAITDYDELFFSAPSDNAGVNLTIQNCHFTDHFGSTSNPIPLPSTISVVLSSAQFNILNSTFNDHGNPLSQSVFYVPFLGSPQWNIKNNVFLNSNTGSFAPGAQIEVFFANNSTGVIEGNTFANNYASGPVIGVGGAIYLALLDHLTIKNNIFLKNKADQKGGAIFVGSDAIIANLFNNSFFNNSAISGGAIYVDSTDGGTIQNSSGNLFGGNKPDNIVSH